MVSRAKDCQLIVDGRVHLLKLDPFIRRLASVRSHMMTLTYSGVNRPMPELERQFHRSRYEVFKKTFRTMVDYSKVTLGLENFYLLFDDAFRKSMAGSAENSECDSGSNQLNPFRMQV